MNTKLLKCNIFSFHLLIIIQIVIYLLIIPRNCYGHLIQQTSYNNNNNNNTYYNHNNTTNNNNNNNTAPIIIKVIPENTTTDDGRIVKNLHDSTKSEIYDYYFSTSPINSESTEVVGRTFGRIKKLQMSLLPVMFKLGVISTIIVIILFLTMKAVGIGLLLLMINIGFIIAKVVALKTTHTSAPPDYNHHHPHQQESYYHGGWQSAPPIWESSQPPSAGGNNKEIHLHIHNDGDSKHNKHEPYGSYSSNNGQIYLGGPSARSSSSISSISSINNGLDDDSSGGWLTTKTKNFRKRPFIYTIDYDDNNEADDDDDDDDDGEYQTSKVNNQIYKYIYRYT